MNLIGQELSKEDLLNAIKPLGRELKQHTQVLKKAVETLIESVFTSKDFNKQMRFLAGTRRSGRTFIAKNFLNAVNYENLFSVSFISINNF